MDTGGAGWLGSLEWLVEWILIGAITLLVLYILQLLFMGGPTRRARAPVLPKRKPALVFLTPSELSRFAGADAQLPVYVAIRGVIYDVTPRRDLYGQNGGYNAFAGRDVARALGRLSPLLPLVSSSRLFFSVSSSLFGV